MPLGLNPLVHTGLCYISSLIIQSDVLPAKRASTPDFSVGHAEVLMREASHLSEPLCVVDGVFELVFGADFEDGTDTSLTADCVRVLDGLEAPTSDVSPVTGSLAGGVVEGENRRGQGMVDGAEGLNFLSMHEICEGKESHRQNKVGHHFEFLVELVGTGSL